MDNSFALCEQLLLKVHIRLQEEQFAEGATLGYTRQQVIGFSMQDKNPFSCSPICSLWKAEKKRTG
jgi:hypothetical protein